MRAFVVTLALVLLGLVPAGVLEADEGDPPRTKEEKVRALLENPGLSENVLGEIRGRLRRMRGLPSGFAEKLEALFDADSLLAILVPLYVKHLDEEALDALLAFNASAEARRAQEAMSRIMEEAEPAVETWVRTLIEKAREEVRREQAEATIPDPGILHGEGTLEQSWLAEWKGFGVVTDIRRADLDPRPGLEIALVGTRGVLLADDETREVVVSQTTFTPPARLPAAVDADGDGRTEYFERRGGSDVMRMVERHRADRSWQALDLRDSEGVARWSYGGDTLVLSMAAGNLDDDPQAEFAVGLAGDEGLHLVDHEGNLVWAVPDQEVWQVEVADLDGDGTQEIVHADAKGRLKIRNADGTLVRRLTLSEAVDGFSLCRWPDASGLPHLLVWSAVRKLRILDAFGKIVRELELPGDPPVQGAWATPVAFDGNKPASLALVVHHAEADPIQSASHSGARGALLVYLSDGTLAYHEVLEELGRGLATIPKDKSDDEILVLGRGSSVLTYTRGEGFGVLPAAGSRVGVARREAIPPPMPDARRTMLEFRGIVAALPLHVLEMDVGISRATLHVAVEDRATLDGVRQELQQSAYFRERARDPANVVETGRELLVEGLWRAELELLFDAEWEGDGVPASIRELSREFLHEAAARAGLVETFALRVRGDLYYAGTSALLSQRITYGAVGEGATKPTLQMLDALLAAVSADEHHRVLGVQWKRVDAATAADRADDRICLPTVVVGVWHPRGGRAAVPAGAGPSETSRAMGAPPPLPDAHRAMGELREVLDALPVRIVSLKLTREQATVGISFEDGATFDGVMKRLEASPYFLERARDDANVAEPSDPESEGGRWECDVDLHFRPDWEGDAAPPSSPRIPSEVLKEAASVAELRPIWASRERVTPSPDLGVTVVAKRVDYDSLGGKAETMTLERLEKLMAHLAADGRCRVTEIAWELNASAGEGDMPADAIVRSRVEISTWYARAH